ncbi:MAG: hypothetical protein R6W95_17675 [Desulfosarcina sp.]
MQLRKSFQPLVHASDSQVAIDDGEIALVMPLWVDPLDPPAKRGPAHGAGCSARMPGPARDRLPANGSGLYTVQALWSMARDSEDVTVVVCANPRYRILQNELARAGILARAQAVGDHRSQAPGDRLLGVRERRRPSVVFGELQVVGVMPPDGLSFRRRWARSTSLFFGAIASGRRLY